MGSITARQSLRLTARQRLHRASAAALAIGLAGCTSVNVRPPDDIASISQVCIVRNPRVTVSDFIEVLQDGFERNGIATSVVEQAQANACPATLTYTALRSWDFKLYISHAELRLWRNGRQIGSADYHLKGKGGFALTKWGSTREKMDPVIDQLLTGAPNKGAPPPAPFVPQAAPITQPQPAVPAGNQPYEPDPAKRCDACQRIGKP